MGQPLRRGAVLPWIAGCWAAGIALGAGLELAPTGPLMTAAAALAAGCASRRLRGVCVCLAALAGGALSVAWVSAGAVLEGPVEVTLEGVVARRLAGAVVLRDVEALFDVALPDTVLLREGRSPVRPLASLQRGMRIRARARLRPPQPLRNPGDPLGRRLRPMLGATGRLLHPGLLVVYEPAPGGWPALQRVRGRVAGRLAARGPGGALLAALSVGRRDALPAASREAVARTGLGHLLAVSGLHLALIGAGAFALGRRLFAGLAARTDTRRLALLFAWGVASLYALLSGGAAPVQRAWVCLSLPVLALVVGRGGQIRVALSAAALLLLLREPLALFSPGAQLSFAAAAALARDIGTPQPAGFWLSLLRTSATALLATAPISALHFAPVAPQSLLLNLAAVPWTAFVLLPGSLLCAASVAWSDTSHPGALQGALLSAGVWLAEGSLAAAGFCAQFVETRPPPSGRVIALAGLLAWTVLRWPGPGLRVAGCLGVTSLLAFAPPAWIDPAPPRLVLLDVGQGDAALLQGRRASVLVDAGVARPDGLDRGLDVVLPALRALGVPRLDLLVVTHGDLDHRGGAAAVLAGLPVTRLWIPRGARRDPRFAALRELAQRRGVAVEERGTDFPPEPIGDLQLTPLWPPPSPGSGSHNDRSLVLRVALAGRHILMPGDLEAAGERALLARSAALRADVLLLPHHGSGTSSSAAFLDAVAPQVALVSAPCLGRFAMPHAEVVARLDARQIPLHWTGRDGALRLGLRALSVRSHGPQRLHCGAELRYDGG